MIFKAHDISQPLAQHIESIFHYEQFKPDHSKERVVPTGHVHLIFELDGFVRHTYDGETLAVNGTHSKVWIAGMKTRHISISAHQNSEMFVVQFKPGGAYPFFHFPIENLNGKVVQTEELFGDELINLREQLLSGGSPESKFKLAEDWLLQRLDKSRAPSNELLQIISKLQSEPVANLNSIIEAYPNTQQHLIRQFKKYVGLTPKVFQRIIRFNDLLKRIQNKETITWAQIAFECGYSDQPHFIKEFKHFSGFNPCEFIKMDHNQQGNFFPLDREG
ncbi:MAG: AraC family transcriptional regulator [Cyclobacteriaceae bacterium]